MSANGAAIKTSSKRGARSAALDKLKLPALGVGGLAALIWLGVWAFGGPKTYVATPEQITAQLSPDNLEQLKQMPPEQRQKMLADYGRIMASEMSANFMGRGPRGEGQQDGNRIRETLRGLDEADQRAFRSGMGQGMEQAMNQRLATFFNSTPEEQEKMLQEDIDRMQRMRGERENRRPEGGERTAQAGGENANRGAGNREGGGERPARAAPSREQRESWMRNRLSDSSPMERAQQQEYFRRLREKMAASGVTPPQGGRPAGGR